MNQFREFLLGVADSPTVKVCCFLVIIIQYLTQHLFVMGVAKGRRRSTYPFIGFRFFCQVGKSRFCFTIPLPDKIGMLYILPAVLESSKAPPQHLEKRASQISPSYISTSPRVAKTASIACGVEARVMP